jgi:PAS domain S-box-containing protein
MKVLEGGDRMFSQPSAFRRFTAAILSALVATALRFYVNPLLGNQSPYLFYAIAIAISAQYGGTIPGLVTTALSFIFAYSIAGPHIPTLSEFAGMMLVVGVGVFISFFFGRRRRAEEEGLRIQYNLETAQHIANVGSWESDLVSGRLWWSAETCNIFGVETATSLTIADFYRLVHPEDRDNVQELAKIAVSRKEQYNVEHRIIRSSGEVRFVHQIAKVICNPAGAPIILIGSIQDITARKLAEQEIRILRGMLPICANCKKIRDDQADGVWHNMESYVERHSEATFTHSICPDCMRLLYGRYTTEDPNGTPD